MYSSKLAFIYILALSLFCSHIYFFSNIYIYIYLFFVGQYFAEVSVLCLGKKERRGNDGLMFRFERKR